jgi:putative phosphoesterase
VKGNCDWEDVPEEIIWEGGGLKFLVTHGHRYRVKFSPLPLRFRAEEAGADIVCFGHSHFPFCEKVGSVLMINPGSISSPRGYLHPTYAVLHLSDTSLKVTYYKTDGTIVDDLGYEEKRA